MNQPLIGDYRVLELPPEDFSPLFSEYRPVVFAENHHLSPGYAYSDEEKRRLEPLRERMNDAYTLRLGIFKEDTFVGWHLGMQVAPANFMMVSTGILEEHRRKGIYTALLPLVLERVKAEGFQVVASRHNLTNNAVIIPKLKAGFVISGFEVNDMYGSLVQLSYFFNPTRRKMLDVRVGQAAPDAGVRTTLGE